MTCRSMLALAFVACGLAAPAALAADVEVMTQNQYVGTDLIGLVESPDFNGAVIDALQTRAASLPTQRVEALAALIAKRNPELVALNEVYQFGCADLNPVDLHGCENPAIAGAFTDQLQETLAALGGRYYAAARVANLDLPSSVPELAGLPGLPVLYDGQMIFVTMTDNEVVLARADVPTVPLPFKSFCLRPSATSDGCNYAFVASKTLTIGGKSATIPFERGFVGVAAWVGGQPYRFVTTHLETRLESSGTFARIYQSGQAAELLGYLEAMGTSARVLLAGDFNSDPRDEAFTLPQPLIDQLLAAGVPPALVPYLGVPPYQLLDTLFTDTWTLRPGATTGQGAPLVGFSCCQDEDLANRKSKLYERIDLIWASPTPLRVQDARLLGESVSDKTKPVGAGVWPSDHASVAAKITFGK